MGRSESDARQRGLTGTVANGVAQALIEYSVVRGTDRNALLRRAGISHGVLANRDGRLPLAKYAFLMRSAKELTGDPALALHFGEAIDIADISVLGLMGCSAATAGDGFTMLRQYGRLIADVDAAGGERFCLESDGGCIWLVDARLDPNAFPELTESTFARMAATMRRVVGVMGIFQAVEVTHDAPVYAAEYERVIGAPVKFGQPSNRALLAHGWAGIEGNLQPSYAKEIFGAHASKLLANLDAERTVRGRVERILLEMLPTGVAQRSAVAERLGLSPSTLQRRLKAEATTFEWTLCDVRRRLAVEYLGERGLLVHEAARLVGYSDPAAFSRAFKRWTGETPRERRKQGT